MSVNDNLRQAERLLQEVAEDQGVLSDEATANKIAAAKVHALIAQVKVSA